MSDSCCYTLADVIEVRGVSTNDTSQDDDGIKSIVFCHLLFTIDKFKTSRNSFNMDVLRKRTVLFQCFYSTFKQGPCNFRVPFRNNDTEAHIAGVWNLGKIVI